MKTIGSFILMTLLFALMGASAFALPALMEKSWWVLAGGAAIGAMIGIIVWLMNNIAHGVRHL